MEREAGVQGIGHGVQQGTLSRSSRFARADVGRRSSRRRSRARARARVRAEQFRAGLRILDDEVRSSSTETRADFDFLVLADRGEGSARFVEPRGCAALLRRKSCGEPHLARSLSLTSLAGCSAARFLRFGSRVRQGASLAAVSRIGVPNSLVQLTGLADGDGKVRLSLRSLELTKSPQRTRRRSFPRPRRLESPPFASTRRRSRSSLATFVRCRLSRMPGYVLPSPLSKLLTLLV